MYFIVDVKQKLWLSAWWLFNARVPTSQRSSRRYHTRTGIAHVVCMATVVCEVSNLRHPTWFWAPMAATWAVRSLSSFAWWCIDFSSPASYGPRQYLSITWQLPSKLNLKWPTSRNRGFSRFEGNLFETVKATKKNSSRRSGNFSLGKLGPAYVCLVNRAPSRFQPLMCIRMQFIYEIISLRCGHPKAVRVLQCFCNWTVANVVHSCRHMTSSLNEVVAGKTRNDVTVTSSLTIIFQKWAKRV